MKQSITHIDLLPTKMRFGFTLAEVLITLGIIGVVAAMTIPNLIATHKAKRFRTQFLKSYSTIQQVFKQMQADDISIDPADYPIQEYYKVFGKYLKGATDWEVKNTILIMTTKVNLVLITERNIIRIYKEKTQQA